LLLSLLRLDGGRGVILPFVEVCLPNERDHDILKALIRKWRPSLPCPDTIWRQWAGKTSPGDHHRWIRQASRQASWKAVLLLPVPVAGEGEIGQAQWLSFLREQLSLKDTPDVLNEIFGIPG
jgi:hypothetical protein